MTSSLAVPYGSLTGAQEARIRSVPPYASSSGAEAIALARLAGIELDPWQQAELVDGMGESSDWKCSRCTHRAAIPVACAAHPRLPLIHPWAAFEVAVVVPRQNGKSELLIARMLAGLFLVEDGLQIYSAHQFDTAMEIFHRLVAVVDDTPELKALVQLNRGRVGTYSHGSEGITLKDGRRIRFKARTGGGGRGFSCDALYLDEAMILPERFLGTTVPTLSARANPQIWLAGSAPDEDEPTHDGMVLSKRRVRALAGDDPSLAYFEHSAAGEHPDKVGRELLDDPEQWALANPGTGIRITLEYIANERRAMGARQFAVERLGVGAWPDTSEDPGRVISREAWGRAAEHDVRNRRAGPPTFAVDGNLDETWGSIGVCGARDDGIPQFAVVAHQRGTDWIVAACKQLKAGERRARFVIDKRGPVAHLLPAFKAARIRVIEASSEDYAAACADFVAALMDGTACYPFPQPELDDALANARKAPLGDRWKWSRKDSASADISPIVAVTLAHWGHCQKPARARVVNLNNYVPSEA